MHSTYKAHVDIQCQCHHVGSIVVACRNYIRRRRIFPGAEYDPCHSLCTIISRSKEQGSEKSIAILPCVIMRSSRKTICMNGDDQKAMNLLYTLITEHGENEVPPARTRGCRKLRKHWQAGSWGPIQLEKNPLENPLEKLSKSYNKTFRS